MKNTLFVVILLVAANIAVFGQVLDLHFVNYNDGATVYANPGLLNGLTVESAVQAFTQSNGLGWAPLSTLSHLLDVELFGLMPAGHHAVSLLFHIMNTVLLFLLLYRMTGARLRSAVVAAFFAIHPLHVEPVVWISSRQDVVGTFFWLLMIGAYARYAKKPGVGRYLLVSLCFVLGLLGKPMMLITAPFLLLVLDHWPLRRGGLAKSDAPGEAVPWRVLVLEKAPLIAVAAAFSVAHYLVVKGGAASTGLEQSPIGARIVNMVVSYGVYLQKMVWPSGLAPFYPRPGDMLPMEYAAVALAVLLIVSYVAMRLAGRSPYLLMGWLWYLVTLAPVIGLVELDAHIRADRHTYSALIGVFIMVVWGLSEAVSGWRSRRKVLALSCAAALPALALCAWFQAGHWRDNVALWTHTLAVTPENETAHYNAGKAYEARGQYREAMRHYNETLRLNPDRFEVSRSVAQLRSKIQWAGQSEWSFAETHHTNPGNADAYYYFGVEMDGEGRSEEASLHFAEALRRNPGHARTHSRLGLRALNEGDLAMAEEHLAAVVRAAPQDVQALTNLGAVLGEQGRFAEAAEQFSAALRIDPDNANAQGGLELAREELAEQGSGSD